MRDPSFSDCVTCIRLLTSSNNFTLAYFPFRLNTKRFFSNPDLVSSLLCSFLYGSYNDKTEEWWRRSVLHWFSFSLQILRFGRISGLSKLCAHIDVEYTSSSRYVPHLIFTISVFQYQLSWAVTTHVLMLEGSHGCVSQNFTFSASKETDTVSRCINCIRQVL